MNLADRMPTPKRSGVPMKIDLILQSMPQEDVDTLRGWLADPALSSRRIADALHANGTPVSETAVYNWRKQAQRDGNL